MWHTEYVLPGVSAHQCKASTCCFLFYLQVAAIHCLLVNWSAAFLGTSAVDFAALRKQHLNKTMKGPSSTSFSWAVLWGDWRSKSRKMPTIRRFISYVDKEQSEICNLILSGLWHFRVTLPLCPILTITVSQEWRVCGSAMCQPDPPEHRALCQWSMRSICTDFRKRAIKHVGTTLPFAVPARRLGFPLWHQHKELGVLGVVNFLSGHIGLEEGGEGAEQGRRKWHWWQGYVDQAQKGSRIGHTGTCYTSSPFRAQSGKMGQCGLPLAI